jgi:hypothetical protein
MIRWGFSSGKNTWGIKGRHATDPRDALKNALRFMVFLSSFYTWDGGKKGFIGILRNSPEDGELQQEDGLFTT